MKHWVFDLDGTLVDSSGHYDLSILSTMNKFKGSCSDEELKLAHKYFNPVEYFNLFFPEELVLSQIIPHFMEHNCSFTQETKCFPMITDLLDVLKDLLDGRSQLQFDIVLLLKEFLPPTDLHLLSYS